MTTKPSDRPLDRPLDRPVGHPEIEPRRIGVLLVNLGTPDGVDYWSMRRYLGEFLSDRRVIEINPVLWRILLHLAILTVRPKRSGRAYAAIWDKENDESPLRTITRSQTEAVAKKLEAVDDRIVVDWAMRYGNPSTERRLRALSRAGCDRILVLPLYPQYSASTTATACDAVFRTLMRMRWQPTVRIAPPYHADPAYIDALADSMTESLAALEFEPDLVLASFHGVPKTYLLKGDPYHCQCVKTGRLLRERLGWGEDRLRVTFQSRFGPAEWLQPYTDKTLEALPGEGIEKVAVITPGFASDCLETLEEIAIGGKAIFERAGGGCFAHLPCLNDSGRSIDLLSTIAARELGGWIRH